MRTHKLTVICALALFLFQTKSHGSMLSQAKICGHNISSSDMKVGGEIEVKIECAMPLPGQDLPLIVEYSLPQNSEILAADGNPRVEVTATRKVLRWEGPWRKLTVNNMRFKITTPGFYELTGRVLLGNISEKRMKEVMSAEVERVPGYFADDERGKLHKREYLSHTERFKQGLEARLALVPATYYIEVEAKSGRVESWDFGSYWKRIKHWFRLGH